MIAREQRNRGRAVPGIFQAARMTGVLDDVSAFHKILRQGQVDALRRRDLRRVYSGIEADKARHAGTFSRCLARIDKLGIP